jgi:hypothetical protein
MASMPAMVAAVDNEGENIKVEVRVVRLKGKGTSIGGAGIRTIVLVKENVLLRGRELARLERTSPLAINSAYQGRLAPSTSRAPGESVLNAKGYHA